MAFIELMHHNEPNITMYLLGCDNFQPLLCHYLRMNAKDNGAFLTHGA